MRVSYREKNGKAGLREGIRESISTSPRGETSDPPAAPRSNRS